MAKQFWATKCKEIQGGIRYSVTLYSGIAGIPEVCFKDRPDAAAAWLIQQQCQTHGSCTPDREAKFIFVLAQSSQCTLVWSCHINSAVPRQERGSKEHWGGSPMGLSLYTVQKILTPHCELSHIYTTLTKIPTRLFYVPIYYRYLNIFNIAVFCMSPVVRRRYQ